MLLSKNAVCGSNKLRIIREQEASGLSSFLELKVPYIGWHFVLKIQNKWNSKQVFISRVYASYLWTICWKQRIQKFIETQDSRCNYQDQLKEVCFHHDTDYKNFKDLPRRTVSDKVLSLHEKQYFRPNAQHKYPIFLFFANGGNIIFSTKY